MLRRIRTHFLAEAIMLPLIGGDAGAIAGLLPALRATRLSPTEALRTA